MAINLTVLEFSCCIHPGASYLVEVKNKKEMAKKATTCDCIATQVAVVMSGCYSEHSSALDSV